MNTKKSIQTKNAPQAIGVYSQARRAAGLVFISGQIPLTPHGEFRCTNFREEVEQVMSNLSAICQEAGGSLDDIVKMTVFLTDMADFAELNTILETYFSKPYPSRAAFAVSALPRGVQIEIEAIMEDK